MCMRDRGDHTSPCPPWENRLTIVDQHYVLPAAGPRITNPTSGPGGMRQPMSTPQWSQECVRCTRVCCPSHQFPRPQPAATREGKSTRSTTALPSPPNAASSACLIFGFPERPSAQEHALSHDLRLKIASRTLAITRKLLPYPLSKPETRTAHTATWDFCPSGTPMCPQTRVWGHGAHHRGALWAPDPLSSCAWQRCQ